MSVAPISLLGGESVYCINEGQLKSAFELAQADSPEGERVRIEVNRLEAELSRNERAAIAFVLINHLQHGDK